MEEKEERKDGALLRVKPDGAVTEKRAEEGEDGLKGATLLHGGQHGPEVVQRVLLDKLLRGPVSPAASR